MGDFNWLENVLRHFYIICEKNSFQYLILLQFKWIMKAYPRSDARSSLIFYTYSYDRRRVYIFERINMIII